MLARRGPGASNLNKALEHIEPEGGAERIAQQIHALLNTPESQAGSLRVRSAILEAADYVDLTREGVARARKSGAILFIVSAVAPFFDETVEFIKREFGSYMDKIVFVVVDDEGDYAAQELSEAIAQYAGLQGVTIRAEAELASAPRAVRHRPTSATTASSTGPAAR